MAPASEPAQTSSWTWADQYRHIRLSPIISLFPARRSLENPTFRALRMRGKRCAHLAWNPFGRIVAMLRLADWPNVRGDYLSGQPMFIDLSGCARKIPR
jgi:hypothetical protein